MKFFVATLALLGAVNAVTYDSGLEVEMVTVPDVCDVKVRPLYLKFLPTILALTEVINVKMR